MENPILAPEKDPSELQKFPLFYEHIPGAKPSRRRSKATTSK